VRQFFFSFCVISLIGLPAIAQVPPSNSPQSQETPASAPAKAGQKEKPPAGNSASVKSPGGALADANASDDFVIGAEDVLEIKVWREPDLTTRAVVRPDGKIGVTLLGDVQASGLSATQLKDAVTSKLERFLEQPEVSVVVVEIHSQSVHLIGAVSRPGAYALGGPLTVVELLARAGGLAETAKADQIAIVRQRGRGELERIPFNYKEFLEGKNLHSNIQLKNGDVVVVR
jgi:polysaccharide export outer membrane protein